MYTWTRFRTERYGSVHKTSYLDEGSAEWVLAYDYDHANGTVPVGGEFEIRFGGGSQHTIYELDNVVVRALTGEAQCEWVLRSETGPSPRAAHDMAYDSGRGVTVVFGGEAEPYYADTWEWNGVEWTDETPAVSPSPRTTLAMAYDGARGVTVLFGGYGADGAYLGDTWEWDGTTWEKVHPGDPNGVEAPQPTQPPCHGP